MRLYFVWIVSIICIISISCERDRDDYLQENKQKILMAACDINRVAADGKSKIKFSVNIPSYAVDKTITLKSTAGMFYDSSRTFNGKAEIVGDRAIIDASLTSSLIPTEDVRVTVSFSGLDTIINISFSPALPDSIQLESNVASMKRGYGAEFPLQTFLIRDTGIASIGQRAIFEALRDNQQTIGEFRAISPDGSDNKGVINSIFVLKDTLYTGKIRLVSKVQGKQNLLTDTLNVFITN
jgi:hypothetical protein